MSKSLNNKFSCNNIWSKYLNNMDYNINCNLYYKCCDKKHYTSNNCNNNCNSTNNSINNSINNNEFILKWTTK